MRSYQAAFTAITLSIFLSACGGESAESETGPVANQPQPSQGSVVSDSSETIVIPPPENGTTSTGEETTEVTQPVTSPTVTSTPVRTTPVTTTPENTVQTPEEPAEVFGAANLVSAAVSGDDVVLNWNQVNDAPQGGYNVAVDGVVLQDLSGVTGTSATVQGLDLSVEHCFTVQARYTQASPIEYFTSNSRCTDALEAENQAPAISGNPTDSVDAGGTYSFTPNATDGDDDNLTFSVTNLPVWAQFDNQTGELTGSPTTDHVGDYSNIVITVSDGTDEASLSAFAITVNAVAEPETEAKAVTGTIPLKWIAPTTRTDGSTLSLSEIQGYCVYVGTTRNNMKMVADIRQGDQTNYIVEDLEVGDYYVAVSVYDMQENMSGYSNIVLKSAVN